MKALFFFMMTDFSFTSEKAIDIIDPIALSMSTILSSKSQKASVGTAFSSAAHVYDSSIKRASENSVGGAAAAAADSTSVFDGFCYAAIIEFDGFY